MNFENFRADIESKFNSAVEFELIEFNFQQYCFGSGMVAYRIKGRIHKFIYDSRDNILTWLISKEHQKYPGADLTEFNKFYGLIIPEEELFKGLNSNPH